MRILFNVTSVPWFLIAFAVIPGVLFSRRISSTVARKDFMGQIVFSAFVVIVSFAYGAVLAQWLYGGAAIAILVAKIIAGQHRRRMMSAFR